MALLAWHEDLNTGIELIDHQHMRIVDLVNRLQPARNAQARVRLMQRIEELIDYTISHFSFEESLMEESNYPFRHAHKRVHEIISSRLDAYRLRARQGEDVSQSLRNLFERWLFEHIRGDDKAYAIAVKKHLTPFIVARKRSDVLSRKFKRLWYKPAKSCNVHAGHSRLQQRTG